jgi:hypothetical protein
VFKIESDEAKHLRDVQESGDGQVFVSRAEPLPEDEEIGTDDDGG